jgi:hypothetical protein
MLGEPEKLIAQVAPAPEKLAPPPKPIEPPRMVEAIRPPDDPGVQEGASGPEAAVRRQFSAES